MERNTSTKNLELLCKEEKFKQQYENRVDTIYEDMLEDIQDGMHDRLIENMRMYDLFDKMYNIAECFVNATVLKLLKIETITDDYEKFMSKVKSPTKRQMEEMYESLAYDDEEDNIKEILKMIL